ncbi:erythromycin esterase family protein [Flavihumibacter sp. RY-1]|uniref:Erythromycin esterase family protein n=1 Tax=Flavihumibacter fluminis TaxID=2909236 RepID=A0ABS9BIB4_9BACT|nr:erythromycin esterase family protein [Flavihumibacter fluminis]MCF1714975.1 erythromycin esterase family protein [Flavihumibacter fluminis]
MQRHHTTPPDINETELISLIKQWAYPLNSKADLQPLFDRIGDSSIVMLGEASHGTHEFYTWRAHITKRLIQEKGFQFIAVEGDWPDCYRLNRFIKGLDEKDKSAFKVLQAFNRWPTWMWANWEMVALADWLYEFNKSIPLNKRAGFYGLDVYSLWESMESIIRYLEKTDPASLTTALEAFRCFEPYQKEEGRGYARASQFVPELCQQEVVELLKEIQSKSVLYNSDPENVFSVEQNARIAVNAEKYYRAMIKGGPHSWNLRDRHMADTLDDLLEYHGKDAKVIVWAHNTHIGDARATDMAADGMLNLGELARIKYGEPNVVLVGFGSYKGSVIAGKNWGAPMQAWKLPDAARGSWEDLLHKAGHQNQLLLMEDFISNDTLLEHPIGHRAVGVVYNPQYEAYGNYVPSILPLRYDAFIHLDETRALHPLHVDAAAAQMPETYPFGV